MAELIHIGIVEDNKFIRAGWESVLTEKTGFRLVGSFANCEDALNDEGFLSAELFLLDISLPGMSGIDGGKIIRDKIPTAVVVMCTVHDDDQHVFDALCAGAVGYLLKKTPPDELLTALRDAYNGGSPMTPAVARKVIASFHARAPKAEDPDQLTDKEQEVLAKMAQGKSYAAIARELFLSVDGVRYHIRHIYEKLQVHSRGEAVAHAAKRKLINLTR